MLNQKDKPRNPSRRAFLRGFASASIVLPMAGWARSDDTANGPEGKWTHARRPVSPYRVWFQPRLFHRDIDLYRHMTIDASGWLDPRLTEAVGKTTLDWVYGLQHPWATGPDYWRDACRLEQRKKGQQFISAGIAIDEWVPPKVNDSPKWLVDGLRAGRTLQPEIFIAVWVTDPTPPLIQLAREGTVDLLIVEGYTHVAPKDPMNWTTSWEGAIRRCQTLADAGLTDKTICCFGHITDGAQRNGAALTAKWLSEKAEELKQRFPTMPGVAYFQRGEADSPALRELVRACDQISGKLWPDNDPAAGKQVES